ncbi:hypothetical protein [Glaciihabitans sp. dw_435]|uniref:hypothetical protein n=1 Tax=Glaciihabitans sp. dw_435 TaxID=2720081 RepID=UPI001C4A3802|nr:hypothetical protein [Glaciihabitans sp. dw_435]
MIVDAAVAVWTSDAGVPVRLVWNGTRYSVSDTPTRLEPEFDYAAMTHPPRVALGWRFQATNAERHEVRVFDVRLVDARRDEWCLVRVYD